MKKKALIITGVALLAGVVSYIVYRFVSENESLLSLDDYEDDFEEDDDAADILDVK